MMTEMVFHTIKYDISIWKIGTVGKKGYCDVISDVINLGFCIAKPWKLKAIVKETKTGFLQKLQILCCSIFGYCRKDGHFSESICRYKTLTGAVQERELNGRNCCIPTTTRRWSTTSNHATCLLKLKWIVFKLSKKLRNWESFWNMKKRKRGFIRQHPLIWWKMLRIHSQRYRDHFRFDTPRTHKCLPKRR